MGSIGKVGEESPEWSHSRIKWQYMRHEGPKHDGKEAAGAWGCAGLVTGSIHDQDEDD
jgi:hypothetical protein